MRERRSGQRQLCSVPDIRDEALQSLPQALRALLLQANRICLQVISRRVGQVN